MEQGRLLELLEEALDSDLSPDQLCADSPELLPELRRRLDQCKAVREELAFLFPSEAETRQERLQDIASELSLPAIPGYECDSILGHGGMGVVYKARHLALNRFVAIKMILSGAHSSVNERARFKREAEALAKLTHPHIVQVYDVGELEGRPYFTMEMVDGGNLAVKLRGEPQPSKYAASVMISLASAVNAAHRRGIVHRDLKPANVLLTADGHLKISDFGLARQTEDSQLLTLPGARMGTPSYMAPEQASKRWGEVGVASDVYALGAILYEMVTGRPPFRGESAADTERQLLNEEVVLPSRLNARVPRDLETICLKCLQKDQARRYESVAALAEDLAHFQNGEPILARRVGPVERAWKWVRRRPAIATAIVSVSILGLVIAAAATWIISQRSATRRLVQADLADVANLQRNSKWQDAKFAITRTAMHLGDHGPVDLQRQLDAVRADAKFVDDLDLLRVQGSIMMQTAGPQFYRAFESAHVGGPYDPPEKVAARIRASNIRSALITALDGWLTFSIQYRPWVLEVLRLADHDPTGWRDHVRDQAVWENDKALAAEAMSTPFAAQPVPFLISMGDQLSRNGQSAEFTTSFLRHVQEGHPNDFWINFILADQLGKQHKLPEELEYLRATDALRPDYSIVANYLGNVLYTLGRREEAIVQYREAIRREPSAGVPKENLGIILCQMGRDSEAIPVLKEAVRTTDRDVNFGLAYGFLGRSLVRAGRDQDAANAFRKSLDIKSSTDVGKLLQEILIRQGHWDEVQSIWQHAVELNPSSHDTWDGYAECCLFLGHTDEYRKVRGLLLDRFGNDKTVFTCDRAGRACLLLGDDSSAIARAAAMIERTVAATGPEFAGLHANFVVGKGLAEYRLGNFDAALECVEGEGAGALKPMPQLIAAMAHYRKGEQQVARRLLAEAVLAFDWHRENATTHEAWIYHVLRREAELLILPNFNALINGDFQPRDNDERLALLGFCTFNHLQGRRAQLWIDALQADPELAKDHLDPAAQIAAAAGAGSGSDSGKYTDEDRARWRGFALQTLSKELAGFENSGRIGAQSTAESRAQLIRWQISPDLVGFRDPAASHLPKTEQEQWAAFWMRVRSALDRTNQSK